MTINKLNIVVGAVLVSWISFLAAAVYFLGLLMGAW